MTFGGKLREQPGEGRDVRARRIALGLTIPALADLAGVGHCTVRRWELGTWTPRPTRRAAILAALQAYRPRDVVGEAWQVQSASGWSSAHCAALAGLPASTWSEVVKSAKRAHPTPRVLEKLRVFVDAHGRVG